MWIPFMYTVILSELACNIYFCARQNIQMHNVNSIV